MKKTENNMKPETFWEYKQALEKTTKFKRSLYILKKQYQYGIISMPKKLAYLRNQNPPEI